LDYKADLIITTGGLGPTDDDSTMASVANCLGKPLEINEEALGYVKERIDALAKYRPGIPTGLTQERLSMAYCPVGGKPLRNPVGVAPGMEYKLENCILIVLPGVPNEMKGIIRETLQPFWSEFLKGICYVKRNIAVRGIPEAELAPFIRKLNREDPGVYVKSRLKVRGKQAIPERIVEPEKLRWHIILHFSLMEYSLKSGRERINRLIDILLDDLKTGYEYPYHVDLGN
jgi:molybdopterin-biosynthesis enzyme MoeA-like protein